MNKYNFSDRMKMLASYVIPNESVADIGTDHGFVPINLIAENKVPFAILTDINAGPLEKAQNNLNRVGILPMYYELRQGNGLEPIKENEVSNVIIAGMGAETIIEILAFDINKTKTFKRLILQPRKRSWELREWLNSNNFNIIAEDLVKEDRKICEVIIAEYGNGLKSNYNYYLPDSLKGHPLFNEFLSEYIRKLNVVVQNMANSEDTKELIKPWLNRIKEAERIKNENSSN